MTTNPFQKATRAQLKARVAFAGPTGSGKTWTSLEWATVLAGDTGRVAVVDTERGSAALYSDHFDFDVMAFDPPYEPGRLADVLKAAEANGYAVVLVDSLSHFWEGEGGTRDIVDAAAERAKGNTFAGWKVGTPALRHLIDTMLGLDAHLLATMRSKMEYVLETDPRGKQVPKKIGLAPVMRAGVEYEFTLVGDIDLEHRIIITKSRCDRLADELVQPGRADEAAKVFAGWLGEGEPLAPRATVEALVARMDALSTEDRKACKQAFMAEFGRPLDLRLVQVGEAESLVARFEERGGGGGDEPASGSAAAPPPPEDENPTQKGGGDDDSAGKGSPGAQPAAAGPGESSSEAESEPSPARQGEGGASASPSPPGVTAEQLLELVTGAPATRKGKVQRAGISVAQALGMPVPTSIDDVIANQDLAAAVLADLRGDDTPPPPSGGGQDPAVGDTSTPPEEAGGSAPAVPAPTAAPDDDPGRPYSEADPKGYQSLNRYCRGIQGRRFTVDDPKDRKNQPQWDALVYAATGGTETELKKATREQAIEFRRMCQDIDGGLAVLVETSESEFLGWKRIVQGRAA